MLIANLYGRLSADPVARQTKAGKAMTTANVAVDVAGKDAEPETLWVSLLAFSHQAEALLRAEKGQMVAAIGRLSRGRYTGKDGTERENWTMLAESVVTAKSARPSGPRREAAATRPEPSRNRAPDFDDDIAF